MMRFFKHDNVLSCLDILQVYLSRWSLPYMKKENIIQCSKISEKIREITFHKKRMFAKKKFNMNPAIILSKTWPTQICHCIFYSILEHCEPFKIWKFQKIVLYYECRFLKYSYIFSFLFFSPLTSTSFKRFIWSLSSCSPIYTKSLYLLSICPRIISRCFCIKSSAASSTCTRPRLSIGTSNRATSLWIPTVCSRFAILA